MQRIAHDAGKDVEMLKFNAWELFAVAVEMEKIGEEFYRAAGKASPSKEVKHLFLELATWETHHQKIFTEMEKVIPEELLKGACSVDSEELDMYLKSFLEDKVFHKTPASNPQALAQLTPEGALEAARNIELEAVVFYSTMKSLVPTPRGQEEVEKIIQEEIRHVQILTSHLMKFRSKLSIG